MIIAATPLQIIESENAPSNRGDKNPAIAVATALAAVNDIQNGCLLNVEILHSSIGVAGGLGFVRF